MKEDIRSELYRDTDFISWLKVGESFEIEFKNFMLKKNIPVVKNEDKRVDYRSYDSSLNKFYEVKILGTFPKPWLVEKVNCNFPICLDYKKIIYYESFLREHPNCNLKIILKLDYPTNIPQSEKNGWYYIEGEKLVKLFRDKPERIFTRQARMDETRTGKENMKKWHLDFSELSHKIKV